MMAGYKLFPESKFVLEFTVTMPYSKDEFDEDKQTKYKQAVAKAANSVPGNVDIKSVKDAASRRAGSVKVETAIRSKDEAGLNAMSEALGSGDDLKKKLNAELEAVGLEKATDITDPVKSSLSSSASRAMATWAQAAAISALALASLA